MNKATLRFPLDLHALSSGVIRISNTDIGPKNARYFYLLFRLAFPASLFIKTFVYHPEEKQEHFAAFLTIMAVCLVQLIIYFFAEYYFGKSWHQESVDVDGAELDQLRDRLTSSLNSVVGSSLFIDFGLLYLYYHEVVNNEVNFLVLLAYAIVFFHSFYIISYRSIKPKQYETITDFRHVLLGPAIPCFILWNCFYWYVQPSRWTDAAVVWQHGEELRASVMLITPISMISMVIAISILIRIKTQNKWIYLIKAKEEEKLAIEQQQKTLEKLRQLNNDEQNANLWSLIEKPDALYEKILDYLNSEFECRLASFWFPMKNGFQSVESRTTWFRQPLKPESDINQLKLILQTLRVNKSKFQNQSIGDRWMDLINIGTYNGIGKVVGDLCTKTFIPFRPTPLTNLPEASISKVPVISGNLSEQESAVWGQHHRELGVDRYLSFPLYWSDFMNDPQCYKESEIAAGAHLIGLFYLKYQADEFEERRLNSDFSRERLENLSRNLSVLFENMVFRRRFERMRLLRDALHKLYIETMEGFYGGLVSLVKDIMRCEVCTLFVFDEFHHGLRIVATTAQHLKYRGEVYEAKDPELYKKIIYPQDQQIESFTLTVYDTLNTCVNHDETDHQLSQKLLLEEVGSSEAEMGYRHISYIAAPLIKNESGEVVGVIRCVNKKSNQTVFRSFSRSDRDQFLLITGILSRFVEYVQWNTARIKSASTLAHDLHRQIGLLDISLHNGRSHPNVKGNGPSADYGELTLIKNKIDVLDHSIKKWLKSFSEFAGDSVKNLFNSENRMPFDIGVLIRTCVDILSIEAGAANLTITVAGLDEVTVAKIDIPTFERAILELIENSIKYSDAGSEIRIICTVRDSPDVNDGWVKIDIENTGKPIEAFEVEDIFNYRVRGKNAPPDRASQGLGLFFVRDVFNAHKGKLTLTSKPGSATTRFSLEFPKQ